LIDKISNLDLLITGDSGPMHVAAAFQIPTVAIFGPTKDSETSPKGQMRFIQGWHSRFFFIITLFLFIHCDVSLSLVGPNIATVGI
jgi:hypothetical protein